jgi:hypothetical protein
VGSFAELQGKKRPHINVGNASGQTFPRLPKHVNGGGTENEKTARGMAGAPAVINDAAK